MKGHFAGVRVVGGLAAGSEGEQEEDLVGFSQDGQTMQARTLEVVVRSDAASSCRLCCRVFQAHRARLAELMTSYHLLHLTFARQKSCTASASKTTPGTRTVHDHHTGWGDLGRRSDRVRLS